MTFKSSFAAAVILAAMLSVGITAVSQSGRGLMHGYVAFEDVSYNELSNGKLHAKVELRSVSEGNQGVYTADTNNTGSYDFPEISMGEYVLKISAPGYKTYQTELYIPSDFNCSLATMMKKSRN